MTTDRTMKVWGVESGRVLHTLKGHSLPVIGVAVTRDGKSSIPPITGTTEVILGFCLARYTVPRIRLSLGLSSPLSVFTLLATTVYVTSSQVRTPRCWCSLGPEPAPLAISSAPLPENPSSKP